MGQLQTAVNTRLEAGVNDACADQEKDTSEAWPGCVRSSGVQMRGEEGLRRGRRPRTSIFASLFDMATLSNS